MTDRPTADDELTIDGDAGAATRRDVLLEIDLDAAPPSADPAHASPGAGWAGSADADDDHLTQFVAEAEPLGSDGRGLAELDEDSPTIAMHTLRLLDPDIEDLDAEATVRLRSLPPPPPAAARAVGRSDPALSAVVLGAGLSMRGEITERMNIIPQTHPMANSIAPGGSPLSVAPPRRPSLRWQLVLGALALVGLGAGASQYLQSWGEQHAAGVHERRGDHQAPPESARVLAAAMPERAPDEARRAAPIVAPSTPAQPVAAEASPTSPAVAAEASPTSPAVAAEASPTSPAVAAPASTAPQQKRAPAALPTSRPVAQKPRAIASASRPLQLAVGNAALRPPPGRPFRPTLGGVNAAIDSVRAQVGTCVGDAHGIADVVLTVRSSGVISHALVQGRFAGSGAGSCIARTLRGARVAPFRKPVVRILYPIKL